MFIFVFACRMETTKTKQAFLFLTCMMHDFLEEMCVAGGTVLFCFARLRTSPV